MIGSILGGIGDFIGAVGNIGLGVGQANREQQAFEYQQSFDRTQMEREDNQLQRYVADAEAAGISPIAAMGKSGSYGAIGSTVKAPSGAGAAQAGHGMSQIGNAARTYAEIELLNAQKEKVEAEAASVSGREGRESDLHGVVREFHSLRNAELSEQVRWLTETFDTRVAREAKELEIAEVRRILARQEELLNEMRVSREYVDTIIKKAQLAFSSGHDSFSFDMWHAAKAGGPDVGMPTGAARVPVTIDLRSYRWPEQVALVANQLAIETNGYIRDITRKKKHWFEIQALTSAIFGGSGAVGTALPYISTRRSDTTVHRE